MKQMNVIPTPFAPTLKDRMFVAVKVDFPGMVITALVGFLLSIICMMRFYYVLDSILRKCHVKISSSEPSLRWNVLDEILDHSQLTFKVQRRSVIFNLPSLKNSITRESLSCKHVSRLLSFAKRRCLLLMACFIALNSISLIHSDIYECSIPETNTCHPNALCTNTEGSYICRCLNGFKGDGQNCTGKRPNLWRFFFILREVILESIIYYVDPLKRIGCNDPFFNEALNQWGRRIMVMSTCQDYFFWRIVSSKELCRKKSQAHLQ